MSCTKVAKNGSNSSSYFSAYNDMQSCEECKAKGEPSRFKMDVQIKRREGRVSTSLRQSKLSRQAIWAIAPPQLLHGHMAAMLEVCIVAVKVHVP